MVVRKLKNHEETSKLLARYVLYFVLSISIVIVMCIASISVVYALAAAVLICSILKNTIGVINRNWDVKFKELSIKEKVSLFVSLALDVIATVCFVLFTKI